ncbi:MAG: IclR family transcriptional regulator [Burkholderiaceae bacterium]
MARPARVMKPFPTNYAESLDIRIDDEDPRFNTALARGLAILRAFQLDDRMLSNVEIAQRTGIPKPTVSRLTFTLTRLGYLAYRSDFGQYELSAGVVGLAYPYLANQPMLPVARPLMQQLASETQTNIGLAVRDDLSALYLEYALGERVPNRRQRVGFRVPLVRTAMGRACIAAMSPAEREDCLERIRLHYPDTWQEIWSEVEVEIERAQTRGYCFGIRTFGFDTASVAVPYHSPTGNGIMAFNSTAHVSVNTPAKLARTGRRLIELVAEVTRECAARPGQAPSLGHG